MPVIKYLKEIDQVHGDLFDEFLGILILVHMDLRLIQDSSVDMLTQKPVLLPFFFLHYRKYDSPYF